MVGVDLERFVIGYKKGVENVLVSSSVQALALPTTIDKTIAPTPRYAYSTASTADVYATDAGAIANHLIVVVKLARFELRRQFQ